MISLGANDNLSKWQVLFKLEMSDSMTQKATSEISQILISCVAAVSN